MSAKGGEVEDAALLKGARNLLQNCIGLATDEMLLIVMEDGRLGFFDESVARVIADEATAMGARVHRLMAPRIKGPEVAPAVVSAALEAADHTIFLARIGDQMRFFPLPGKGSKTMCYALDNRILEAEVCTLPYGMSVDLLRAVQEQIDVATTWRVTCANGTDISGTSDPERYARKARLDFTLKLFPVGPFRPLSCATASGRVVTRFLPASATHLYEPFGLLLEEPVTVLIEQGRIVGFEGPAAVRGQVQRHYDHVGAFLDIDPFVVHSWHGGTNPCIYYPDPALENLERWNGVVHSHPRYTHFHTCGNYGPGEIALSLLDATITFDERLCWSEGRLVAVTQEEMRAIAARYGCPADTLTRLAAIGI